MPKGRSKGFGHYMCKKFFHPGNPENLERVYLAKEKVKAKEKAEKEKLTEYEREQERWNNRAALVHKRDRDKLALSFMYEPPAGMKAEDKPDPDKKDVFKFDWQRNAPRAAHCKEDPNIVDHPFGINVQFTKCMKCQIWGHQHTDKHCPRYGKARDEEEPAVVINEKKLIEDMRTTDRLQFTSFGSWDNGKVGKHYDLVYDEGRDPQSDLMSDLLKGIRGKEAKIKVLRAKVKKVTSKRTKKSGSKKSERTKKSSKSSKSDKRKKYDRTKSEGGVKSETISEKSRVDYLNKIDDILFSDIGPPRRSRSSSPRTSPSDSPSSSQTPADSPRRCRTNSDNSKLNKSDEGFLSEVDKILGIRGGGNKSDSEEASSDSDDNDDDEEEEDDDVDDDEDDDVDDGDDDDVDEEDDDLTEGEMRLLNLININKIDVKVNFKLEYKDINCHFCRVEEDTEHLSSCPVYDGIMRGTEFKDIKSQNARVVKRALCNIRQALVKRSKALSVTSVGPVTIANMELLDLPVKSELDETTKKAIEILNNQKFKIF